MGKEVLSRRDFLKRSGWAAGAIALGSSSAVLWDIACGPSPEKRGNTLVELIPASPERLDHPYSTQPPSPRQLLYSQVWRETNRGGSIHL